MGAAQIDQKVFQHSAFMKASAKTRAVGSPGAPQLEKDSYSLPSHDALAQILPHDLQSDPHQEPKPAHSDLQSTSGKRLPLCVSEEDLCGAPVAARRAALPVQEVQRYRDAMGRMAADMISLRTQMVALQTENSRLRSHLAEHEDPGLDVLRDTDLDVMTKAEMADRIASLSFRLSCEHSQSTAQNDRILRLQNQLIRKNDSEKELLRLKTALQRPPGFAHQEQRRMRELEATVRHQGKRKETATIKERLGLLAELERTEARRHIQDHI